MELERSLSRLGADARANARTGCDHLVGRAARRPGPRRHAPSHQWLRFRLWLCVQMQIWRASRTCDPHGRRAVSAGSVAGARGRPQQRHRVRDASCREKRHSSNPHSRLTPLHTQSLDCNPHGRAGRKSGGRGLIGGLWGEIRTSTAEVRPVPRAPRVRPLSLVPARLQIRPRASRPNGEYIALSAYALPLYVSLDGSQAVAARERERERKRERERERKRERERERERTAVSTTLRPERERERDKRKRW